MFTRFIRYLLRTAAAAIVILTGGISAAPAIASTVAANDKSPQPTTQPVPTVADGGLSDVSRMADADELRLAKESAHRAVEPVPSDTTSIPVQKPVIQLANAPVKTPPAKEPVPVKAAPKPVVKPPIKTVKEAVKAAVKPVVNKTKLAAVLAFARAQIGEAYVMGGAGPNVWDCSGLTMKAFQAVGIDIGGHGVNVQYQKAKAKGYLVPWSQRKAGDLVFYGTPGNFSHVAISAGGNVIIEAANPARPVIERPYWGQPYGQVARFLR